MDKIWCSKRHECDAMCTGKYGIKVEKLGSTPPGYKCVFDWWYGPHKCIYKMIEVYPVEGYTFTITLDEDLFKL